PLRRMSRRPIGVAEAIVAALASAGAVALVTAAIAVARPHVPVLSLGVLYVFAVLPVAVAWGLAYAIPVSVASMLAFNFFFLPPTHTFALRDNENWFALVVYLVTAVVVSELDSAVRDRLFPALAALVAVAVDRDELQREALEAEMLRRSDAAKTALLRAVSHDLRSPLTAIDAAASGLQSETLRLRDDDRRALLATIRV